MPEKLDLYKQFASEYTAKIAPAFVSISPARYLAIAGRGEPGSDAFSAAIGALYNMAFTIKMASKFAGQDYAVSKLEGLWWADDPAADFMSLPRDEWNWKLLIRIPDFVTAEHRQSALDTLAKRGKDPIVSKVLIEEIDEGICVQILHVGPYSTEHETIGRMKSFAADNGRPPRGPHHEIYLSDPRRVASEKWRTILRQPVA